MPPPVTEEPPVIVPPAPRAPPAPQVQVPSSIPRPPAPPQRTYLFSTVHPPITFAPETRIQDLTMEDVETQTQTTRVPREEELRCGLIGSLALENSFTQDGHKTSQ